MKSKEIKEIHIKMRDLSGLYIFNSKSSQAFYQEIKGATMGGGEQQAVIKIKIVKVN